MAEPPTHPPLTIGAFGLTEPLTALGTAHDALLGKNLRGASLANIVANVLDSAGVDGQYDADGPPVACGPRATLSTSLLLHELATNALKYGSLSAGGTVTIRWVEDGKGECLTMTWSEQGGPAATAPTRKGFGTRLLSLGMMGTGGSELRYDNDGFSAQFSAQIEQLKTS